MTSASQSTVEAAAEVVGRFNEAWSDHDLTAALALISDDCVFESTSPAPDGERHVGRSAIQAAWVPIFADSASHFTVEDSFSAGPHFVQATARWTRGARGSDPRYRRRRPRYG